MSDHRVIVEIINENCNIISTLSRRPELNVTKPEDAFPPKAT